MLFLDLTAGLVVIQAGVANIILLNGLARTGVVRIVHFQSGIKIFANPVGKYGTRIEDQRERWETETRWATSTRMAS